MKEAKYHCTIQAIKPDTCRRWYCEPLQSLDSEFNICVLNFGKEMEYPPCNVCQTSEINEEDPQKKRSPTQCEKGEGCSKLEKRVRYFLCYAKAHQLTNNIVKFSKKLIEILKLQQLKYIEFLKKELKPTDIEFELNINNYADLITEINSVIK